MHQYPAIFILAFLCKADSIVIIELRDRGICPQCLDIVKAFFRTSLRHINNAFLSQTVCSPGDPAAMIAVCSRNEGDLPEFFFHFPADQLFIRKLRNAYTESLCNIVSNRVTSAENFKCIQSEAIAFVLYMDGSYPELLCQSIQLSQRGFFVFGETFMKCPCLSRFPGSESINRKKILPCFSGKMYRINFTAAHVKPSCE